MLRKLFIIKYTILQCTWGLLQTLVGLCLYIKHIKYPHSYYHGCIRTAWPKRGGVSLGLFIFVDQKDVNRPHQKLSAHEYGHTIQSLLLGPLYLLVIGLPSFTWSKYYMKNVKSKGLSYDDFWIEKWADQLGNHFVYPDKNKG